VVDNWGRAPVTSTIACDSTSTSVPAGSERVRLPRSKSERSSERADPESAHRCAARRLRCRREPEIEMHLASAGITLPRRTGVQIRDLERGRRKIAVAVVPGAAASSVSAGAS